MDQLPTPTEHTQAPSNHPLSASPQPSGGKSLAIALAVSAVFLLAAAGIAIWLVVKPAGSTTVNQESGDGSANVKKVTWVVPPDMPAAYTKRTEDTHTAQTTFYDDNASICTITTAVHPVISGKSPKDVILAVAAETKDTGIVTAGNTSAGDYSIADSDGSHTYTFASEQLDQDVSVPGVSFTKQTNVVAYKQFGSLVASIGFSCKADSWEAKKPELEALIKTFKVKTER